MTRFLIHPPDMLTVAAGVLLQEEKDGDSAAVMIDTDDDNDKDNNDKQRFELVNCRSTCRKQTAHGQAPWQQRAKITAVGHTVELGVCCVPLMSS